MTKTEDSRRQLISRIHGGVVRYVTPDGYTDNGEFYSRQQPQYGEYLPLIVFAKPKAEYMAGHEAEPVYKWTTAPQDSGAGITIKFE